MSDTMTHAEKVLAAATCVGFLHHVDHVLRVDHSGWPFVSTVTPFTFSLLVYVPIAAAFFYHGRPLLQAGLAFVVFAFATFSHIYFETPIDQYRTWAGEGPKNVPNLLGVVSPSLGVAAMVITVLLSIGFLAATLLFLKESLRDRVNQ